MSVKYIPRLTFVWDGVKYSRNHWGCWQYLALTYPSTEFSIEWWQDVSPPLDGTMATPATVLCPSELEELHASFVRNAELQASPL